MSRVFASKSIFGYGMMGYDVKSIINPVMMSYSGSGFNGVTELKVPSSGGIIGLFSSDENTTIQYSADLSPLITETELLSLTEIQSNYTAHLKNKTYSDISDNYIRYVRLRDIASDAVEKYRTINSTLALMFQITVDGITGAINSTGLNNTNTELRVQNIYLQNVLEEMLSEVNVKKTFDETSGTLSMKKTFQLAPLFRYYIRMYGVPAPGVGFDPVKLSLVLAVMENNGIDPYTTE
jgi:hypothetical protein